jgi:hypothetical protein
VAACAGTLLDSFSGALPQKLMELLARHKGEGSKPRANWLLVALLGGVAAAVTFAVRAALQDAPAAHQAAASRPAAPASSRQGDASGDAVAAPLPPPEEQEERVRAPAKKSGSGPSKGARQA